MSFALELEHENLNLEDKISTMRENKINISPIFKWIRYEKHIIEEIKKHVPKSFSSYWEPYTGGGALLFDIQHKRSVINVCDEELYNIYRVIRDDVNALIEELKKHKNEKEYYYELRDMDTAGMSSVENAARNIYLNKTCFNGFFRKSESGQFDVPFGSYKNPRFTNKIILKGISAYLKEQDVKLISRKFESFAESIPKDSFIYIAPENNFRSQKCYDFNGCARLKNICDRLDAKGVKFLISHSYNDQICDIFNSYEIIKVKVNRNISSVNFKNDESKEIIIKNYATNVT
ncbi:DNA adenine methylase [Peptoclostridium acidaminophilum]|nr:Dam family site-specific DNA-(adenine-N6)-methyltransferase [Peptoclostridium acidaminophilum]